MKKVAIDEIDRFMGPSADRRPVARALEAENMGLNYYELAPGDSFAFGYHMHEDQEEVFYVQEGEATFETEEGDVTVGAGEAIRFAPGEYQRGTNVGDERVVAIAIGAPENTGRSEILRECPDCGERTPQYIQRAEDAEALVTICEDCGAETGRFT